MSSDSTSTDDEYERIKEAVDENFLTKDLFINGESKKEKKEEKGLPKPKSLRNQSHQEVSNNPFSIKVTPEFQKHVSKHLSRLLDDIIDDQELIIKHKKRKKSSNNGVKLLCSSKDYLSNSTNDDRTTNFKKLGKKDSLDEDDYEKRAKEVAVTPEWVLSQEETRHWAPSTKGVIEIVKIDSSKNFKSPKKKKKKPKI